jgi:protein phosphatase
MIMQVSTTMDVNTAPARAAGSTHPGNVRISNQDIIIVEPDLGLYAVFDGMGGAAAGDVAARIGAATLIGFIKANITNGRFTPRHLLELAIRSAGIAVFDAAARNPEYLGMGTTVVACLLTDSSRVAIGHAGDSRAYRLHRDGLFQLTRDHTVVQQFVESGKMKPEDVPRSFIRSLLTRNLGDKPLVKPEMLELDVESGDRLLLCSDGLYGGITTEEIHHLLASAGGPECITQRLVDRTLAGEASDNVSVIVIER